jgi:hypothetical protein
MVRHNSELAAELFPEPLTLSYLLQLLLQATTLPLQLRSNYMKKSCGKFYNSFRNFQPKRNY